jgi:hypothetical protein
MSTPKTFENEFFDNYLSLGLGGMSKKDTESLVMYLIDKYGINGGVPLRSYPNQEVSAILKTPVNKIKQLRYESGLKYWGRVEDQAKARLLAALSGASFEIETKKICLIIEDSLAKNWLQGQLKNNNLIFDFSFNTEIIKVETKGLFAVLGQFFDAGLIDKFRQDYEAAQSLNDRDKMKETLSGIAKKFAESAASAAGTAVFAYFKSLLPI